MAGGTPCDEFHRPWFLFGRADVSLRHHAVGAHHAAAFGEAEFGVVDEAPQVGNLSPETLGGTSVRISLVVADPDAVAQRAIDAGAELIFPVEDQPYGWRQGRVRDPFGHHWLVGRPIGETA